jgi:hypothetical protein
MTIVVLGVSVATSFSVAASLAFSTALVLGAMLVHELPSVLELRDTQRRQGLAPRFLASVVQYTIRFSIAALAVAWTVVSLQWYPGAEHGDTGRYRSPG